MIEQERNEQKARERSQRDKRAEAQFRADLQDVMGTPGMRRVMARFLDEAAVEHTAFRLEPAAMAHACGWQDAGRWWLEAIRDHCPERETQMRAEAKRNARDSAKETEDDNGNE